MWLTFSVNSGVCPLAVRLILGVRPGGGYLALIDCTISCLWGSCCIKSFKVSSMLDFRSWIYFRSGK